jgi:hypothetical protein
VSIIEELNHWRANMMPNTLTQASFRTMAARNRSSERGGFVLNAGIALALLLVACMAHSPAAFAHAYEPAPLEFSAGACYRLVQEAGRPIAWARWEKGLSLEKTRSTGLRDDKPAWVIDLVRGWISDAYRWRATDEQIRQWAAELGSVDNLPSVETLSVHETIAIWLRRIARLCDERDVHASASANLIGGDVGLEQ